MNGCLVPDSAPKDSRVPWFLLHSWSLRDPRGRVSCVNPEGRVMAASSAFGLQVWRQSPAGSLSDHSIDADSPVAMAADLDAPCL